MDKRKEYIKIIKSLLLEYAKMKPANGDIETEPVFDEDRGHYQLLSIGWKGTKRIHHTFLHIELQDDHVWLQHNATDQDIAEELIEMGIPRDHIVLGSVLPQMRKFTKYGY
jgi:hypothetical protein